MTWKNSHPPPLVLSQRLQGVHRWHCSQVGPVAENVNKSPVLNPLAPFVKLNVRPEGCVVGVYTPPMGIENSGVEVCPAVPADTRRWRRAQRPVPPPISTMMSRYESFGVPEIDRAPARPGLSVGVTVPVEPAPVEAMRSA